MPVGVKIRIAEILYDDGLREIIDVFEQWRFNGLSVFGCGVQFAPCSLKCQAYTGLILIQGRKLTRHFVFNFAFS